MSVLEGGKISGRQFMAVLTMVRLVPVTLVFSMVTSASNPQDAWIASIISGVVAIPFAMLIARLSLKFPGKTIIEYSQIILGPVLGKLVGLVFLWFSIQTSVNIIRALGEAYVIAIMPETPIQTFMIMLAIMSCYAARSGLEVLSRLGEDALFIIVFVFLFTCVLPYNAMRLENLLPVLAKGMSSLIPPVVASLGYYSQFIMIGMLVPYLAKPEEATKYAIYAVLISGFLTTAGCVSVVAALGTTANSWTLPLFSLARLISLGEFFERIEAGIMAAWTLSAGIKLALFLWAISVGIAQLFNLKRYEPLVFPLAAVFIPLALVAFESMVDLEDYLSKADAVAAVIIAVAVIALLYAGLGVRSFLFPGKEKYR